MSCDHRDTDRAGVCRSCGHHSPIPPRARARLLTRDFVERDESMSGGDPLRFPGYTETVRDARQRTGSVEAVVWGHATVSDIPCVLVVFDFSFLGGSMGRVAGEKVARAFDAARADGLPVVVVTASGGARMQEGMVSLVQMPKTVEARRKHMAAGLGQVTLLASPTTGGVYASFASLADVVLAEPQATVTFAGPRVVADMLGSPPSAASRTAEHAHAHGLVDAIVGRSGQRATLTTVLRLLTKTPGRARPAPVPAPPGPTDTPAWERLQLARHEDRPSGPRIAEAILTDRFELRGDRAGHDDDAVRAYGGVLRTTGVRLLVLAQDRTTPRGMRPSGYRKARRTIATAARLGLPLVTLVDTRGADPLPDSEAGGIAQQIARTMLELLACPAPTLAVVTGEGGSGGALALAACDRVIAWENSVFSVIAPEGAASILHRDTSRAPEMAESLRIGAPDLVELGVADALVREPRGGAHRSPARAVRTLAAAVGAELDGLLAADRRRRLAARSRRWRHPDGTIPPTRSDH